jgi:hypothetical protein
MGTSLEQFIRIVAPEISDDLVAQLVQALPAVSRSRGEVLVRQGDVAADCYFVLTGCLRMYFTDEQGNEKTSDFFTEQQSLVIFESYKQGLPSPYSVECVEDSLLLEGDLENEETMNDRFPFLKDITRSAMEDNLASSQQDLISFKALSPAERYLRILETPSRPGRPGASAPAGQLPGHNRRIPEPGSRTASTNGPGTEFLQDGIRLRRLLRARPRKNSQAASSSSARVIGIMRMTWS